MSVKELSLTIDNGQSVSSAGWGGNLALIAVRMPSAWTAAPLTIQIGVDGDRPNVWEPGAGFTPASTWLDLYDWTGVEFALTVAASRHIPFHPASALMVPWVRVRSGTAAASVNQTAARTVTLLLRGVS